MYEVANGMCKAGKAHFPDQMPLIKIILTPWLIIALCFDFKAVLTSLKRCRWVRNNIGIILLFIIQLALSKIQNGRCRHLDFQ